MDIRLIDRENNDGVKLWYFTDYLILQTLGCKDIGIRKSVAKTQFLYISIDLSTYNHMNKNILTCISI